MISIKSIQAVDFPTLVEFDEHVPVAVRTFSRPIGASFYRVGNFDTSLVEIPIDPDTGLLRGVKVVCIDRYDVNIDSDRLQSFIGLPVILDGQIPDQRRDDECPVAMAVRGDRLLIDWSNGAVADTRSTHDRLHFLLGNNILLGAEVGPLTDDEIEALRSYWPNAVG